MPIVQKTNVGVVVGLTLILASCGTPAKSPSTEVGKPLVAFPEPQVLARFLDRPVSESTDDERQPVEEWSFEDEDAPSEGAAPIDVTQHPLARPLEALAARNPHLRFAHEADCVAREVARVYERLDRLPDARFVRFAQGRCGLVEPARFMALRVEADASASDADLWRLVEQQNAMATFTDSLPGAPGTFGLALAREGRRAAFGFVWSPETVRLEETRPVPDAQGDVILRGTIVGSLSGLDVLVNRGRHDSAVCEVARDDRRFQARCPMLGDDETTWVEFVAAHEGVVLGTVLGRVWAHRGDYPSDYAMQHEGAAAPDVERFSRALAREINVTRAQARRRGFAIDANQSTAASALTPHLFEAVRKSDTEMLNAVSLGLLAGWNLERDIRSGSLYALEYPGRSPKSWLAEALESPLGRRTLLDGADSVLSLGVDFEHERSVRVVANAFRVFEADHARDEEALALRLAAERSKRGLSKLTWVEKVPELDEAIAAVASGRQAPGDAMREAMQRVATSTGRSVHAAYYDTYRIDDVRIDDRLLASPNLTVALRVTHYRPPGAAWSQLAVLMLLIPEKTA